MFVQLQRGVFPRETIKKTLNIKNQFIEVVKQKCLSRSALDY